MPQLPRTGQIRFHDAALSVWEDGAPTGTPYEEREHWERVFKRQVFLRIIQQLRRLGWTVQTPAADPSDVKHYGRKVARYASERKRFCQKGDLKADLSISGRCIELKMFQSVNCPNRPDHEGRYEYNKESVMPYLVRLEMERTRRRLRTYLCNVFASYAFDTSNSDGRSAKRGPNSLTAEQWVQGCYETSWHFKGDWQDYLAKNPHFSRSGYRTTADGQLLDHGQRVWFFDRKGRCCTGIAMYNINNMWWVITGKYWVRNEACFELYASCPENPRQKRNEKLRRKRLEDELAKAQKLMNFERAALLRDIIFPKGERVYLLWHEEHKAYHCANFSGYTTNAIDAGKFTLEQVKAWGEKPNKIVPLDEVS